RRSGGVRRLRKRWYFAANPTLPYFSSSFCCCFYKKAELPQLFQ
ncbi:MAG: hypothetical protein ACI8VT_001193, partial [Saprospiraceae bacterium]